MTTPTKPLYCIRFTLVNTTAYTATQVLNALKPGLEAAGATVYQTPAIRVYTPAYSMSKEGPFDGDDSNTIFEKMSIAGPSGVPIVAMRDMADPKGTRPVVEQRKAIVSAFAWNIGPPANTTPEQLGTILFALLKKAFYNSKTYTGFSWAPLSSEWEQTLVKLSPYPDRPALPKVLTPVTIIAHPTEPAPTPKPPLRIPETVITVPITKPPMPDPITNKTDTNPSWLIPVVAGIAGLGFLVMVLDNDEKHKRAH
jgi:hypothetical protein